jgi:hypothetical protein
MEDAVAVTSSTKWKTLWQLPVPPNVKVFAWRVIHNGLAVPANKKSSGMEVLVTCALCGGVLRMCTML